MVTAREVEANKLIEKAKEELKRIKEIQPPKWAGLVKSGSSQQRPPQQQDFWYIRTASVLRRIYIDGPVGTSKLRTYYGGRRKGKHKPARFKKGSGNIIRKILQQLESAGFVKKVTNARKKGRIITSKGQKFLDRIAYEVKK